MPRTRALTCEIRVEIAAPRARNLRCGMRIIQFYLFNFMSRFYLPIVNSMNPNIKLTDDSGIMFGEKRDSEPNSPRDLDIVSY